MLSYPDSKELKELGYGQELKEGDRVYLSDGSGPVCVHTPGWYADIPHVKVPTTDGMIEGLRDEIQHIIPLVKAWEVETYNDIGETHLPGGHSETEYESFVGTTLDQALCELWKKVKTVPPTE